MADDDQKVKVVVRVRPFNKRELELDAACVINMDGQQTILTHPTDDRIPKRFTFDHSFYSLDSSSPQFSSQEDVFSKVGSGVLENAFCGYNACILAYGQTGSGKSYSMMGSGEQSGVIPRLCNAIFNRIEESSSENHSYKVEVSYMEIYNERVRDLLDPKNSRNLKVREHKIVGPMVDGLSELAVSSYGQIERLLDEGNKARTVASTNMNAESSRSHAVFSIRLTQTLSDPDNKFSGEKVAKISLVDLAGSERAQKSGAVGKRLEEGGNINKSLTTLGMVISALAEKTNGKKEKFVPYRDSVLTWLLKDSLGGNSRTVMIATISPASDNYEETLSTLRYADRAKKIVNHAVVNEDPNARVIRELREEVETLRLQISQTRKEHSETEELRERLAESERIVEQMNKSWEERLKETDVLYKERQRELADIGVSVESGGIKVEKNRFYLVNLNADPTLNELLVYYVNSRAIIGNEERAEDGEKIDIVLQGFGVQSKHARLDVSEEEGCQRLFIQPLAADARVCVNGREISERTPLRNGFRLLIGFNHFFRVNCPKNLMSCSVMDESSLFDYDDAWHEANAETNATSMTSAVDEYMQQISLRHQEEKQSALEQQYDAFERYINGLAAGGLTPSTPMTPSFGLATPLGTPASALPPFGFPANPRNSVRSKFFYWAQKREEQFAESLARLKTEIVRANSLVREANLISAALPDFRRPRTNYDVTLQIPAANLRPSKIKAGSFVCEPVIVVRRTGMSGCQVWSVEQLENKLVEMRESYNDCMAGLLPSPHPSPLRTANSDSGLDDGILMDPFFESHENHCLIGVANVFLEVLFHDIKLAYQVPVISQQGEVVGRLHVEIQRVFDSDEEKESCSRSTEGLLGKVIKCRVGIRHASSLPSSLSHFVFCQYSFFNLSELLVVAPSMDSVTADSGEPPPSTIHFNHAKEFSVVVSEEFLEYVHEDALSIEVWGHRSCGFDDEPTTLAVNKEEKIKTLQERWAEVSRRLCLSIQISELNEEGLYAAVEVEPVSDVLSGGVYQLKQGQQRRVSVSVSVAGGGGSLPLLLDDISSVALGAVTSRSGVQRPLDSYQEEDLERIRAEWTAALQSRQRHLEEQINRLPSNNEVKEPEREFSLMEQWVALTEERTAVSLPTANTAIPGAPADWTPPPGVEKHIPVLFLNLKQEEMSGELAGEEERMAKIAGAHSLLPKEHLSPPFILLTFVQKSDSECSASCSWDSSLHESAALNLPTPSHERIYATLKVCVQLGAPCRMQVVLRKRICLSIYKKPPSIPERLFRRMIGADPLQYTSVFYDLVAHLPKSSHEMEDRSSLALMAARQAGGRGVEEDTRLSYIDAYTRSIQAVESMLKLDRLRQECTVSSLLRRKDRQNRVASMILAPNKMKRAVSMPDAIASPPQTGNGCHPTGWHMADSTDSKCLSSIDTSMCTSSDSASMETSLVSPLNERLAGILEEGSSAHLPPRSVTVPDSLVRSSAQGFGEENGNSVADSGLANSAVSTSSSSSSQLDENVISTTVSSSNGVHSFAASLRNGGNFDLNISAL